MSEFVLPIVGTLAALVGGLVTRWLGARSENKSQQRNMIMEIYRPLIADLRTSMEAITNEFETGYGGISLPFSVLDKYFMNSTMKAIEGYDKDLYIELEKINTDLRDDLSKLGEKRREAFNKIRKDWESLLIETGTDLNIESFVVSIHELLVWEIWRGNIDHAKNGYDSQMENMKKQVATLAGYTLPPELTFSELVKCANEEMDKVKCIFPTFEERFKEIEGKVISRMEETIKSQF